jgi:hypothetical protein
MPKLSLSRAWEETTAVLAHDGRLFLAVGLALFVLPGLIVGVVIPPARAGEFPAPGLWLALALVAIIVWLVGQLAVIWLAIRPQVAVGEAIVHGVRRLVPYVIAVLVWLIPILVVGSALSAFLKMNERHPPLIAAIALIALTIFGAFLAVRLVLSSAVASAEHGGPFAILRRSWELSRGNWWRLFVFVLLFWIGALCLVWAVGSVAGVLARMVFADIGPLSVGGLLIGIVSQLLSSALSIVFFVMLARLYVQRAGADPAQASVPKSGI